MKNVLPFTINCLTVFCLLILATAVHAQPPYNDDFDSATFVAEPLPFVDSVDTAEATTSTDDPDCFGTGSTVWYSYTPSADGFVTADTFGSTPFEYDTTLGVYTGRRGRLKKIACNDDFSSGTLKSRIDWEAEAGETYYLIAANLLGGSPPGLLNFTVEEGEPPLFSDVVVNSASVAPNEGIATVDFTATFDEPVFVDLVISSLLQRRGGTSIFWRQVNFLREVTDAVNLVLPFRDMVGDEGYVGGPAQLCVNAVYDESTLRNVDREKCVDIRLEREVATDIKPFDVQNEIDPYSPMLFSVGILSDDDFDALQTDLQTIRLEPGGATARNYRVYDANRDRIPDLVPLFRARDLRIGCGETDVKLTGKTHAGIDFYGTDVVRNRRCPK